MQLPPIEVLLSWPTPNYVNPTLVRGPELFIITLVFLPIAMLMVALRVFTRLRITKCFGVDDMFLVAATVPITAVAILIVLAEQRWGWNRHIWDVPTDFLSLGLKLVMAIECVFGVSVSFTKLSLLILTRRVMIEDSRTRRIATFGIAFIAMDLMIFIIVVVFTCNPVSAYWTLSLTPQKCIDEKIHLVISGTINTLTDFLVVFLPLPTVFNLRIPVRQQIITGLLFGAGFSVCVAGTFRIYFEYKSASTYDRTWVSYGLFISSVLELYVGIICTSATACKPFFTRYLPALLGSSHANSKSTQNSKGIPNTIGSGHSRNKSLSFIFSLGEVDFQTEITREMRRGHMSKFNSRQPVHLSYLNISESGSEQQDSIRGSNETRLNFFVGPTPTNVKFPDRETSAQELRNMHHAESLERLVGRSDRRADR